MTESLQVWISWPTLPFTILLAIVVVYWILTIVGAFDVELLDFDLDFDANPESFLDWGLVALRWLGLGDVPLMLWLSAFALPAWLASALFDKGLTDPTTQQIVTSVLRSVGIGFVAARLLTLPMKGKLKLVEPNPAEEMIGRTCEITTTEATSDFGQARCEAEGAPLLLNVRTVEGTLGRGTLVEIVDYSPDQHVYFVRGTDHSGRDAAPLR